MVQTRSMSDAFLLAMIVSGRLTMTRLYTRNPRLYNCGRLNTAQLYTGNGPARYRYKIHSHYKDGVRYIRSVARAKLVWMYVNRQLVPVGCEIHHKDEDRLNDCQGNLECTTKEEHVKWHYGCNDF